MKEPNTPPTSKPPETKLAIGIPAPEATPPVPMKLATVANLTPAPTGPIPAPTHPAQSLGDLYSAIDSAPVEWLPSLLARVVKRSLKSGAWGGVENLILSVRGFSK
jgi:hypothetical protein